MSVLFLHAPLHVVFPARVMWGFIPLLHRFRRHSQFIYTSHLHILGENAIRSPWSIYWAFSGRAWSMSDSTDLAVHSNVLLHLLQLNDKFGQCYDRWSHDTKQDRDILCILLKDSANIDGNLVHTMHLPTPAASRALCAGPYFVDRGHEHERQRDLVIHVPKPISDSDEPAAKKSRFSFTSEEQVSSAKINPDRASALNDSIQKSNHSLCSLGRMTSGRDESGVWLAFDLVAVGRIHLGFFNIFALSSVYTQVKSMSLRLKPSLRVFLRLYDDGDRRVVRKWGVCPAYKGRFVRTRDEPEWPKDFCVAVL